MDYEFINVLSLIDECIQKAASESYQCNYFLLLTDKEFSLRVNETFFNWIKETSWTSKQILHLLQVYIDKLKKCTSKVNLRKFLAFICLQAIVKRRPVIKDKWVNVIFHIVKYCQELELDVITNIIKSEQDMVKIIFKNIQEMCDPEKCPNPGARLLLISLLKFFNYGSIFNDLIGVQESFRENIINTICDMTDIYNTKDKYSSLQHFDKMSVDDFVSIVEGSSLDLMSIMGEDIPDTKRTKIIAALIKISRMLNDYDMDRYLSYYFDYDEHVKRLRHYLSFCGLISNSDSNLKDHVSYFIQIISDKPLLLDSVINAYKELNKASEHFLGKLYNKHGNPIHKVTKERDMILMMFYKHFVGFMYPALQISKEIKGGFTSATQYRVRFFHSYLTPFNIETYNAYGSDKITDASTDFYYFYYKNSARQLVTRQPHNESSEMDESEEFDSDDYDSEDDSDDDSDDYYS